MIILEGVYPFKHFSDVQVDIHGPKIHIVSRLEFIEALCTTLV
jgi:hypothetical protein